MTTPEAAAGTDPAAPDGTDHPSDAPRPAPVTGHHLVDAALAGFGNLADHPADQHHARLSQVSDLLAGVLEDRPAPGAPGSPTPGAPTPGPR